VGYYLDRSIRLTEMKSNLKEQVEINQNLLSRQSILRTKYDDAIKINQDVYQRQKDLMNEIEQIHNAIQAICPNKQLQSVENIGKTSHILPSTSVKINTSSPLPILSSTPPPQMITSRTMSVPTAAALKQGVGFPLNSLRKDDTGRILSTQCINNDDLLNECGICKKCNDQHLLAKCDTCHLYYHLGCLNPPLTRHPKKSKLYAWQCSECDKSDDSAPENVIIPKGPRRSRIRYSKDGLFMTEAPSSSSFQESFGSEKSMSILRKKSVDSTNGVRIIPNGNDLINTSIIKDEITNTLNTNTPALIVDDNSKKRGKKMQISNSKKASKSTSNDQQLSPSTSIENNIEVKHIDTIESLNLSDDKKPKKGRPRKRTLSQISSDLQKQQELNHQQQVKNRDREIIPSGDSHKSEVTVMDLSRKVECPLDQYRAFANIPNSIPYPVPSVELPKLADEPGNVPAVQPSIQSAPEIVTNGAVLDVASKLTNGDEHGSTHHKHKKRKSHKRRHSHSHSPSSSERQSGGKKRKKKHKHLETLTDNSTFGENRPVEEQPPIKIKFRAILQAGDDKKKPKFLWHVPHDGNEQSANLNATFNINQVLLLFVFLNILQIVIEFKTTDSKYAASNWEWTSSRK
jgi:PHD-finger